MGIPRHDLCKANLPTAVIKKEEMEKGRVLMKAVKMFFLTGLWALFASASTFAVPLNITFTGGEPQFDFGYSVYLNPGFIDYALVANAAQTSSINLAGANSINMTWQAPAGYMYVVNPPPAGLAGGGDALYFEADYGSAGQAASLGSITASSLSVHTIYGTSPLRGEVLLNNSTALYFGAIGSMTPNSAPFAISSITISAAFSGTGIDTTLERTANDQQSLWFATLTGDFPLGPPGPDGDINPIVPPGIGPMLTLEPLPSGSAPDAVSALPLAGLGFAGLLLIGRLQNRLPANC